MRDVLQLLLDSEVLDVSHVTVTIRCVQCSERFLRAPKIAILERVLILSSWSFLLYVIESFC